MTLPIRRRTFAVLPLVILAFAVSACEINLNAEKIVQRDEKTFAVTGTPELVLSTFDGGIEIQAWDRPEVQIVIEKHLPNEAAAADIEVKATQNGNRITVEVVKPKKFEGVGIHMGKSAKLIVSTPKLTHVTARTGDGGVTVNGISGRIELRSGDGGIRGTSLDGDLTVHTGDGGITLEGVQGRLDLNTGDGGIRVSGKLERLKVHTGDGGVQLEARTGSQLVEDWEITTGDGSVTLRLPEGINAELDARTGDGRISADEFGLRTDEDNRDELKGRLGAGGRALRIRTGDGSISVNKN
jgi:Putative adhesin